MFSIYAIALLWGLVSIIFSIYLLVASYNLKDKINAYNHHWNVRAYQLEQEAVANAAAIAYLSQPKAPKPTPEYIVTQKDWALNELQSMNKLELEAINQLSSVIHPSDKSIIGIYTNIYGKRYTYDQSIALITYFPIRPTSKPTTPLLHTLIEEDSFDQPRQE